MNRDNGKGKFVLIKRTTALGVAVIVDEPKERLLTAGDVLGASTQRAKVFGMTMADDFPPALGEMERGDSVMVAKKRDESEFLFLLKVSEG
ncbi:MAG: hypothetical protein SFZ02_19320 [bacterium]|nr:hypothetical protein [bacterium]